MASFHSSDDATAYRENANFVRARVKLKAESVARELTFWTTSSLRRSTLTRTQGQCWSCLMHSQGRRF